MHDRSRGDFAADRRLFVLSGLAIVIGAVCSFVAVALIWLISFFTNLFYFHRFSLQSVNPGGSTLGPWMIAIPVLGGLIIGLMARYGTEKIRGHGIPEALEAILFGKSIMNPKVAVLKPLSSAISIGSGGPFGAEGPIIMTGGAFGSLIAQAFHLTAAERKTLLVAGAAAGMSAVFASPMAAVLLAIELLLFEWKPRSLIPVALASIVSAAIRPLTLGSGPLFPVPAHDALNATELLAAGALGLVAGAFSAVLSTTLYKLEDMFSHLKIHWMWWPALGGLAVGIGGYFEPRALGVGYDTIAQFLKGDLTGMPAMRLLAVKAVIWLIALASGTSGGVLAPLLIMGCGLGVIASNVIPTAHPTIWPMLGMAATLGGMMRSPFTAVIFAFELTYDVQGLLPLLVAAVPAYALTVLILKRSILTEKVARRGYDIFREYWVDPLERVRVSEIMTKEVVTIPAKLPVAELSSRYFGRTYKSRGYPVVAEDGTLLGVMTAADLTRSPPLRKVAPITVLDLIDGAPTVVHPTDPARHAAELMAERGIGRLPVVEPGPGGKLVGIVTRSDLLKPRLTHLEEERTTERIYELSLSRAFEAVKTRR
jgi:H+/Cl- antiporter ClcA/predicted transcriptional regulator